MAEKYRRDVSSTTNGNAFDDLALSPPRKRKADPETVTVSARIHKELMAEIKAMANQYDVKPGRLIAYGMDYFIQKVKTDPNILKFETRRELKRR